MQALPHGSPRANLIRSGPSQRFLSSSTGRRLCVGEDYSTGQCLWMEETGFHINRRLFRLRLFRNTSRGTAPSAQRGPKFYGAGPAATTLALPSASTLAVRRLSRVRLLQVP